MPESSPVRGPIRGAPYDRSKVERLFTEFLRDWPNQVSRSWLVDELAPNAVGLYVLLQFARFSPRQAEAVTTMFALTETCEPLTQPETAQAMGISVHTLRHHLPKAQGKFVTAVVELLYLRAGARLIEHMVLREHPGAQLDADVLQALVVKVALTHKMVSALHDRAKTGNEWAAVALAYGLHDGIPHTQAEVAETMGLSEHSISRLIGAALSRIWVAGGVMAAYNELTITDVPGSE